MYWKYLIWLVLTWGTSHFLQAQNLEALREASPALLSFRPPKLDSAQRQRLIWPRLERLSKNPKAAWQALQTESLGLDFEADWHLGWRMTRDRFEFWVLPIAALGDWNKFALKHINRDLLRFKNFFYLKDEHYSLLWNKHTLLIVLPTWAYTGQYPWRNLERRTQLERQLFALEPLLNTFQHRAGVALAPSVAIQEDLWFEQRQTMLQDSVYQGAEPAWAKMVLDYLRGQQFVLQSESQEAEAWTWSLENPKKEGASMLWAQQAKALPLDWQAYLDRKAWGLLRLDFDLERLPLGPSLDGIKAAWTGQTLWRWEGMHEEAKGKRKVLVPDFLALLRLNAGKQQLMAGALQYLAAQRVLQQVEEKGKAHSPVYVLKHPQVLQALYVQVQGQDLRVASSLDLLKRKGKKGDAGLLPMFKHTRAAHLELKPLQKGLKKWPLTSKERFEREGWYKMLEQAQITALSAHLDEQGKGSFYLYKPAKQSYVSVQEALLLYGWNIR